MSPGGNTILLVFAILSGLVSAPTVRLLTLNDTVDRKLGKNVTEVNRIEAEEEILLTLERQPRNAVAGKPFEVQPCVLLLLAKARPSNTQLSWSVNAFSKFSDKCHVEGSTKSKGETRHEFKDLKIDKPAIGCILVFELVENGKSSQIESLPFDVLATDMLLTISSVHAKYNRKLKSFNLSFSFDLKHANQILRLPAHYSVLYHQPFSNTNVKVSGPLCSANFSQAPITVSKCFLNDWGYRNRLIIKIESNSSGWSISNRSEPFDAYSAESESVKKETFKVSALLKGKESLPSDEEHREQVCASVINQLGKKYPHMQWSDAHWKTLDNVKNEFFLIWTVKGKVKDVQKLYNEISLKVVRWNSSEWTVLSPINITDTNEKLLAKLKPKTKLAKASKPFSWKSLGPLIVIGALLIPVGVLFCIWPRREREIRKKYQERLSHYVLNPEGKQEDARGEDNLAFQSDKHISTIANSNNNPISNGVPHRSSLKVKTDLVQLKAAQLTDPNVPDPPIVEEIEEEGPQRIHILRSRPPSKPTVVSPATAQYASVEAPSPDDSIENLARDILATPITVTETNKGLTGTIVTSFVKFRSTSEPMGSRISVSAIANPISSKGSDRHSAGTTLPEPQ